MAEGARSRGALVAVGTGIRSVGQLTMESVAWLRRADIVLFGVRDVVTEQALRRLNDNIESLGRFYGEGKPRRQTYAEMVERILECVHDGLLTVVAVYGHPAVFVTATHEAIRQLRGEGIEATMLPAVSAEDCLFADLGVDPAIHGCQSYEATDFYLHNRIVDPRSSLVIWQIGIFGEGAFRRDGDTSRLGLLVERLLRDYPPWHPVVVYESAVMPNCAPFVNSVPLAALAGSPVPPMSTLYVPPVAPAAVDPVAYRRLTA
jgi:uncharacterized protein YabN with tetrapyrrole methylase and pyrophosphatase domain